MSACGVRLDLSGPVLFLNVEFANRRKAFVKGQRLQFTMRELLAVTRSPLYWAALVAVGIVLGVAGPFGTYEALALPPRLAYWLLVVIVTYFTADLIVGVLKTALFRERPGTAVTILLGAVAGPFVAGLVWLMNLWILPSAAGIAYLPLLGYVTIMTATVAGVISYASGSLVAQQERGQAMPAEPAPQRPALLDRLPAALRGRLLYLSMQDHYVEVVTDKGSHLVLMRLADAIGETTGTEGMQVHRSHWVARDAVAGSIRDGARLTLRLVNGAELPVSRSKLADVRKAGLA